MAQPERKRAAPGVSALDVVVMTRAKARRTGPAVPATIAWGAALPPPSQSLKGGAAAPWLAAADARSQPLEQPRLPDDVSSTTASPQLAPGDAPEAPPRLVLPSRLHCDERRAAAAPPDACPDQR
ncbi:hypothetical protein MNEG_8287, partial [Monoraphidium neglectum]